MLSGLMLNSQWTRFMRKTPPRRSLRHFCTSQHTQPWPSSVSVLFSKTAFRPTFSIFSQNHKTHQPDHFHAQLKLQIRGLKNGRRWVFFFFFLIKHQTDEHPSIYSCLQFGVRKWCLSCYLLNCCVEKSNERTLKSLCPNISSPNAANPADKNLTWPSLNTVYFEESFEISNCEKC